LQTPETSGVMDTDRSEGVAEWQGQSALAEERSLESLVSSGPPPLEFATSVAGSTLTEQRSCHDETAVAFACGSEGPPAPSVGALSWREVAGIAEEEEAVADSQLYQFRALDEVAWGPQAAAVPVQHVLLAPLLLASAAPQQAATGMSSSVSGELGCNGTLAMQKGGALHTHEESDSRCVTLSPCRGWPPILGARHWQARWAADRRRGGAPA
jgi:hypothetical protein